MKIPVIGGAFADGIHIFNIHTISLCNSKGGECNHQYTIYPPKLCFTSEKKVKYLYKVIF